MNNSTTVEADPKGALSYLRALKQNEVVHLEYHPDQYESDWFTRGTEEVQERLGRPSLWSNPSPVGVGRDYETLVNVNIGGNHQVIDDVSIREGVVTSMKTLDTDSFTYRTTNRIFNRGRDCVDAFETFRGVERKDGLVIPREELKGFNLEIAVRDTVSDEQKLELRRVQEYGKLNGVRVIIVEVA
jgi:hypothetical protein